MFRVAAGERSATIHGIESHCRRVRSGVNIYRDSRGHAAEAVTSAVGIGQFIFERNTLSIPWPVNRVCVRELSLSPSRSSLVGQPCPRAPRFPFSRCEPPNGKKGAAGRRVSYAGTSIIRTNWEANLPEKGFFG